MSNQQSLEIIAKYNKLPETPEKAEIDRKFISNEIGHFEFFQLASRYLEKQSATEGA